MIKPEEHLCYYYYRNPDNTSEYGKPTEECMCDNCFRGKTKLANALIDAMQTNAEWLHLRQRADGYVDDVVLSAKINKFIDKAKSL